MYGGPLFFGADTGSSTSRNVAAFLTSFHASKCAAGNIFFDCATAPSTVVNCSRHLNSTCSNIQSLLEES